MSKNEDTLQAGVMPALRSLPRDPAHPDAAGLLMALSTALEGITGNSDDASFAARDVRGEGALFLGGYAAPEGSIDSGAGCWRGPAVDGLACV